MNIPIRFGTTVLRVPKKEPFEKLFNDTDRCLNLQAENRSKNHQLSETGDSLVFTFNKSKQERLKEWEAFAFVISQFFLLDGLSQSSTNKKWDYDELMDELEIESDTLSEKDKATVIDIWSPKSLVEALRTVSST